MESKHGAEGKEKPQEGQPKDQKTEGAKEVRKARPERTVQNVIRLGETNINGDKPVRRGILEVRGVSFSLANAISSVCSFSEKKIGDLSEEELKKLDEMINFPEKYGIPSWLYNRRKDFETGENKHLTVSRLELTQKLDIGKEKKIKSYKGVRHISSLPVRGQRTRGSFRKGSVVGVARKAKAQKAAKSGK